MVTLLALTAGVALAATVNCADYPCRACFGTECPDKITGTSARDEIDVLGGIDAADGFEDLINCGTGPDDFVEFDQDLDAVATNCEEQVPG